MLDDVAFLASRYRAREVVTDQHLSATVVQGLKERGVDRVHVAAWSGRTLTAAFSAVRARVVSGSIELPKDDLLVQELTRVRSRMRGGTPSIEIPRSAAGHLDSALALAAGVLRLEQKIPARRARGLSSFGPGYISEHKVEEILDNAVWSMR